MDPLIQRSNGNRLFFCFLVLYTYDKFAVDQILDLTAVVYIYIYINIYMYLDPRFVHSSMRLLDPALQQWYKSKRKFSTLRQTPGIYKNFRYTTGNVYDLPPPIQTYHYPVVVVVPLCILTLSYHPVDHSHLCSVSRFAARSTWPLMLATWSVDWSERGPRTVSRWREFRSTRGSWSSRQTNWARATKISDRHVHLCYYY